MEETRAVIRARELDEAQQVHRETQKAMAAWKDPTHWRGSPGLGVKRDGQIYVLTWNLQSALGPSDTTRSTRERWFALLHALHYLGVSIACLQETGVGNDIEDARRHVLAWSRAQSRTSKCQARLWCGAGPPGQAGAGRKAGVAIIAFGVFATRGQLDRVWKDGSTVAVQFAMPHSSALTVTCQYAPQGGGNTKAHGSFREATSQAVQELNQQTRTSQLWCGDY